MGSGRLQIRCLEADGLMSEGKSKEGNRALVFGMNDDGSVFDDGGKKVEALWAGKSFACERFFSFIFREVIE